MIGVSLPFKWLLDGEGTLGDRDALLDELKQSNVRSVELRSVKPDTLPDDVKSVAEMLWDKGFMITVHGTVSSVETAVENVFKPLESVLAVLRQPSLNVTIHPVVGDNAKMLTNLSDYIRKNSLPVTIALENNRLMPDKTEGDSAELVLNAVAKVDRPEVGICFDFGHYIYYRTKNRPEEPYLLPPKEFFKRVIHTHIHGLSGLKTHFPLDGQNMPLGEIFNKLSFEYFGLYNLELDFPRFKDEPRSALLQSVKVLDESRHICAKVYDEVRDNFDRWFLSALTALDGNESGTKFGLSHSSSYLFNTNGYRWGMDVAFRNARFLASTPKHAVDFLKDHDLMVISHNHRDHFEESTTRALAKTDIEWVIPDFIYDVAIEWGINPQKIHVAREGQPLTVGKLTFLPFEGRHFRPGTTHGVPEYGYFVTAEGSPSIVFPVDVRDLSLDGFPKLPDADYCFANVWLGDGKCLEQSYDPIDREFSKFMLKFSDKNIILTHLNEDGRKDKEMWRNHHAELVKAKIQEFSPKTRVLIPNRGETMILK